MLGQADTTHDVIDEPRAIERLEGRPISIPVASDTREPRARAALAEAGLGARSSSLTGRTTTTLIAHRSAWIEWLIARPPRPARSPRPRRRGVSRASSMSVGATVTGTPPDGLRAVASGFVGEDRVEQTTVRARTVGGGDARPRRASSPAQSMKAAVGPLEHFAADDRRDGDDRRRARRAGRSPRPGPSIIGLIEITGFDGPITIARAEEIASSTASLALAPSIPSKATPSTGLRLPIPFDCRDGREGDFQILTRIDVSPGMYGDMTVICFAAPAMKFE